MSYPGTQWKVSSNMQVSRRRRQGCKPRDLHHATSTRQTSQPRCYYWLYSVVPIVLANHELRTPLGGIIVLNASNGNHSCQLSRQPQMGLVQSQGTAPSHPLLATACPLFAHHTGKPHYCVRKSGTGHHLSTPLASGCSTIWAAASASTLRTPRCNRECAFKLACDRSTNVVCSNTAERACALGNSRETPQSDVTRKHFWKRMEPPNLACSVVKPSHFELSILETKFAQVFV